MPDSHMKRLACQIAAQLPDSQQESLEVLGYVREIVMNLGGGWGRPTIVQPTPLFGADRLTGLEASQEGERAGPIGRLDRANPE